MFVRSTVLVLVLSSGVLGAEVPRVVLRDKNAYDAQVAKLTKAYEAAVARSIAEHDKTLQEELTKAKDAYLHKIDVQLKAALIANRLDDATKLGALKKEVAESGPTPASVEKKPVRTPTKKGQNILDHLNGTEWVSQVKSDNILRFRGNSADGTKFPYHVLDMENGTLLVFNISRRVLYLLRFDSPTQYTICNIKNGKPENPTIYRRMK